MILKNYLLEGCNYTPSDLVDRGERTIICNLNAQELPDFPAHDVAVFAGVFEYVYDIPRLISHLSNFVYIIIASYGVTDYHPVKVNRRKHGWVNDYSSNKFENIFLLMGFRCDRTLT